MRKRNPELSDVSKRLAMQWIKCNSDCSLAVRRLFPWVHLSHGATSTRFSRRVRAVGLGFPRSPQRKLLRAGPANVGGRLPAQSPVQSRVERTGAIPARRQSERYRAHLARRTLSLCWSLNQHPALLGREDCTLVAWYRCLYAPRTGGAYGSHHWTAGIASRARRRGGGVAPRSARAAASSAGARERSDWTPADRHRRGRR